MREIDSQHRTERLSHALYGLIIITAALAAERDHVEEVRGREVNAEIPGDAERDEGSGETTSPAPEEEPAEIHDDLPDIIWVGRLAEGQ